MTWTAYVPIPENARFFAFVDLNNLNTVTWSMREPAETFVSRVIANPRHRFFKSSPFKIFFPLKIKYGSGKPNDDFYVVRTFNDLPTFRNIFLRVRSVILTTMAAMAAMMTSGGSSIPSAAGGGKWGRTSDDYAQVVKVTSLMAYTVGGARHVYVQWDMVPRRERGVGKGIGGWGPKWGTVPFDRVPDSDPDPRAHDMM